VQAPGGLFGNKRRKIFIDGEGQGATFKKGQYCGSTVEQVARGGEKEANHLRYVLGRKNVDAVIAYFKTD